MTWKLAFYRHACKNYALLDISPAKTTTIEPFICWKYRVDLQEMQMYHFFNASLNKNRSICNTESKMKKKKDGNLEKVRGAKTF